MKKVTNNEGYEPIPQCYTHDPSRDGLRALWP